MPNKSNVMLYCPVCRDNRSFSVLAISRDCNNFLCKCPSCQLRHMHTPKQRDFVQEPMYGGHVFSEEKTFLAERSVRKYVLDIRSITAARPKTLLDLGGGLGYYSRAFSDHGIEVTYVEKDACSLDFASKHKHQRNLRIVDDLLDAFLESSDKKYDVIFFRHVVEHLFEPENTLKLLRQVMHPSSVLIAETDNNRSKELVYHPQSAGYWRKLYHEEFALGLSEIIRLMPFPLGERETHYWGFNIDNFATFISGNGLRVARKREYPLGDKYFWPNVSSPVQLLTRGHLNTKTVRYFAYRLNPAFRGAGLQIYAISA